MKATLEIPDDLYRRVKARSALEGRTLRAVAIELFQNWLHGESSVEEVPPEGPASGEIAEFPWLDICRKYLKPGTSHEMEDVRESISRGWAAEVVGKIASPLAKP